MTFDEVLSYNPETGEFTWLVTRGRANKGAVAGKIDSHGYIAIGLNKRHYRAHRLAWFMETGEWPSCQIDHINGNKIDNRWINLRLATHQENQHNWYRNNKNKTGYQGVSHVVNKNSEHWLAYIKLNDKQITVGKFDSPEEASEAYIEMKKKLHPYWNKQATSAEVGA